METKPHGHGDVHMLLHMHGLAKKWAEQVQRTVALPQRPQPSTPRMDQGLLYVTFFQDTNPLMFHTFAASLGYSEARSCPFPPFLLSA